MSISGPGFYAWCNDVDIAAAFAASVSAALTPGETCKVEVEPQGPANEMLWQYPGELDTFRRFIHERWTPSLRMDAGFALRLDHGARIGLDITAYGKDTARRLSAEPLRIEVYDRNDFLPRQAEFPLLGKTRNPAVEAAAIGLGTQADVERLLLCLCAPTGSRLVQMGACSYFCVWHAHLELNATYHRNAMDVARDIALSFVHLHEGVRLSALAELSLDALAARIHATPEHTAVGIAPNHDRILAHAASAVEEPKHRHQAEIPPDRIRNGPRAILSRDEILTREEVLRVVNANPDMLLDALEACAMPDKEWRAVEPQALDAIKAKAEGAPTATIEVNSGHHRRFLEEHAPFHIRRLENGALLLATHPYRTLWPLWAEALRLLDIRA